LDAGPERSRMGSDVAYRRRLTHAHQRAVCRDQHVVLLVLLERGPLSAHYVGQVLSYRTVRRRDCYRDTGKSPFLLKL
jgi:hypothetical protein